MDKKKVLILKRSVLKDLIQAGFVLSKRKGYDKRNNNLLAVKLNCNPRAIARVIRADPELSELYDVVNGFRGKQRKYVHQVLELADDRPTKSPAVEKPISADAVRVKSVKVKPEAKHEVKPEVKPRFPTEFIDEIEEENEIDDKPIYRNSDEFEEEFEDNPDEFEDDTEEEDEDEYSLD